MKKIKEILASLRVFKRLRLHDEQVATLAKLFLAHAKRIEELEAFIDSREPCDQCGKHRYRQKTLHRASCG